MTRFFEFNGEKIPVRRDEATEIYVQNGTVLERLVMLLGDGSWCEEGAMFTLNRLGERESYRVERVEYEVDLHQRRGKYGQLRRRVLAVQIPSMARVNEMLEVSQ